jgi:hypothetical protein
MGTLFPDIAGVSVKKDDVDQNAQGRHPKLADSSLNIDNSSCGHGFRPLASGC